jgi:hypothetical protein
VGPASEADGSRDEGPAPLAERGRSASMALAVVLVTVSVLVNLWGVVWADVLGW